MQIVIDIPKEFYNNLLNNNRFSSEEISIVSLAVASGIPPPQNHGDLKDMNDIYEALESWNDDTGWIIDAIDFQTETIVKADEGEE